MVSKRRRTGRTPSVGLGRRVANRERESLLRLVTAAGASPHVRHRWPSVGHLVHYAVRASSTGGRPADLRELAELIEDCRRDDPRIERYEDFVPSDPRDRVLGRVGNTAVRLFPGSVERPVADVSRWSLVADAVDDYLISTVGFGVRHYTELALRYADHAIGLFEPAWPADELDVDGPVRMTLDEMSAAATLLRTPVPGGLIGSDESRAAFDWATAARGSLAFDVEHGESSFGRYLAVTLPGPGCEPERRLWLPLAYLPEAAAYGVTLLAERAMTDGASARRFARLAADRLRRALFRFANHVYGAPDQYGFPRVSDGDVVQWIARVGERRALAVQMVVWLGGPTPVFRHPPEAMRVARAAREHPDRPVRVRVPQGSIELEPGVDIVPLLVVAAASHSSSPAHPQGLPVMSLDDVTWASTTADHETDLFTFCQQMADPSRPQLLAFETIDVWEWWRSNNKTLFGGASRPTALAIEPHWGRAEWDRSVRRADLEAALATLRLSPIRDWLDVDDLDSGPPAVWGWSSGSAQLLGEPGDGIDRDAESMPALVGWQIYTGRVPVAVRCGDPAWQGEGARGLNTVAGSLAFGFGQIVEPWTAAHAGKDCLGYLVRLAPSAVGESVLPDDPNVSPVDVEAVDVERHRHGYLVHARLGIDTAALAQRGAVDEYDVHAVIAGAVEQILVRSGMSVAAATTVRETWTSSRPTFAAWEIHGPPAQPHLPEPWPVDQALVSAADQAVATVVRETGTSPGRYLGDDARTLDRDVLAPAALRLLTERLQRHLLDEVVVVGMRQIDRVVATKRAAAARIHNARGMNLSWDPVQRAGDLENEHAVLRRSCEIAIEAALRIEPTGTTPVDQIAWMEIIAAARAYLAATSRSEALYYQLNPTALTISDLYEIEVGPADPAPVWPDTEDSRRVYVLDIEAFRRARAEHMLGPAMSPLDAAADDMVEPGDAARTAVPPVLDEAMLAGYGASALDILTVLTVFSQWPLPPGGDHVVCTTRTEAVQFAVDNTVLGEEADGPARAAAAVDLLTSNSDGLRAVEWRPWRTRNRQRRLLAQPLVQPRNNSLIIAPHLCIMTVGLYFNYLQQGALPWSQPEPPARVNDALKRVRDDRNRALEREVATIISAAGYSAETRVKATDPQRLRVPALSGEIDVVAGRAGTPIVWLLEVKDPVDIVVASEIRRHLDTFYVGHKKTPAYLTQLQRKTSDLEPHVASVALALGLPVSADGGYKIRPVFVTRRPVPAAFVQGPVPFVAVDALVGYLNDTERTREGTSHPVSGADQSVEI